MRSEFQANAVSTTREKCLVRKTISYSSSDHYRAGANLFFLGLLLHIFRLCQSEIFCGQCVIIQATNLRVFLGSNKTIVTFATSRELTCSLEREDKELGTGTLNKSEAKFALQICIAMIQTSKYIFMYYFHYDCSLLCYDFPESTPLDEYLKNKKIVLNLDTLFVVAVDLMDAIQCLENRGIVHNNIATSTVLIAEGFRVSNKCLDFFLS